MAKKKVTEEQIQAWLKALPDGEFAEFKSYEKAPAPSSRSRISLGDLDRGEKKDVDPSKTYYMPDWLGGSDFSGGSVTLANQKAFLEEFGKKSGVHPVYGGHGTYGVAIRLDHLNDEIVDMLSGLSNYPSLDDDMVSQVENEAEEQAWESWVEGDFKRELVKTVSAAVEKVVDVSELPLELEVEGAVDEAIDKIDAKDLKRMFYDAANTVNEYWVNEEGNNAWIDVKKVTKGVDLKPIVLEVVGEIAPAELTKLPPPHNPRQLKLSGVAERKRR